MRGWIAEAVVFKQIGAKIAYYRTLRGMHQVVLAEKIGISSSVLSRIERGKYNENVSVSMLLDIAEGLGIDVALFVTFDEHEKAMWECEIDNSQPYEKYMGV